LGCDATLGDQLCLEGCGRGLVDRARDPQSALLLQGFDRSDGLGSLHPVDLADVAPGRGQALLQRDGVVVHGRLGLCLLP
jgi:hypothetical protein